MNTISNMPSDARLWVYQSNTALSDAQVSTIKNEGANFISDWAAHGASLKAAFDVLYDRFIVIAVDEQQAMATGCSIDKSVKFVKELEQKFNLNLFDRMQVAYRKGNEIVVCSLPEFEKLANEGS
ncbi:MAG: ABC transporter ATPase, partial [Bacteroidia bacterium]